MNLFTSNAKKLGVRVTSKLNSKQQSIAHPVAPIKSQSSMMYDLSSSGDELIEKISVKTNEV